MTPTLRGRWQTRFLLLITVGALVTAVFGFLYRDFRTVFTLLGYVLAFGLVWDMVYAFLQSLRWDHDWSPALYFLAGIWEAVILFVLVKTVGLPGLPQELGVVSFLLYYVSVWGATFVVMFGPMRIIFPRWRFRGGQWL